ncbi:unnamed protein product [Ectocarpus sp. 8 AP-2014]
MPPPRALPSLPVRSGKQKTWTTSSSPARNTFSPLSDRGIASLNKMQEMETKPWEITKFLHSRRAILARSWYSAKREIPQVTSQQPSNHEHPRQLHGEIRNKKHIGKVSRHYTPGRCTCARCESYQNDKLMPLMNTIETTDPILLRHDTVRQHSSGTRVPPAPTRYMFCLVGVAKLLHVLTVCCYVGHPVGCEKKERKSLRGNSVPFCSPRSLRPNGQTDRHDRQTDKTPNPTTPQYFPQVT